MQCISYQIFPFLVMQKWLGLTSKHSQEVDRRIRRLICKIATHSRSDYIFYTLSFFVIRIYLVSSA
jgi:hypothetical protein